MAGYNYRVLISEKQFLQVKRRAMKLSGTDVVEILYDKCDLIFKSRSGTYPNLYWYQTIRILDLNTLSKLGELTKQKDLNKVIRDSGVKVYCNCLHGDTLIKTTEGLKAIRDITTDDYVVCSNGSTQQVVRLIKNEKPKEFVSIRVEGKETPLVCSKDHKIKTIRRWKTQWIKAGDLRTTDYVVLYTPERAVAMASVEGITPVECSESYDICLFDEPHDYIANGIVVSNCPAFLYWGFMYMAWKKGYGLKKELRVPRVRNPLQRGYVCFPKGTQVLTYYGYKPIEIISNGDILFTHSSRLKKVLSTFSSMAVSLVRIKAEGTEFEATIDHKFPVLVNGQVIWKTALSLIPDSDYLISPVLCEFDKDYPVNSYPFSINFQATFPYKVRARKVLSKVVYSTYEPVYNLEVEEDNTYIVNGVATSNCKHLYQCLIVYPFIASTVAKKFKEYYAKLEERNNRARGLNNPISTPQNN